MLRILLASVAIASIMAVATPAAAEVVEVQLIDKLDEPRGFCIDIIGSKTRARPERGLQGHTCYGYQGAIAVDQGFDPAKITHGEFFLPGFGVCMRAASFAVGARLLLGPCDKSATQRFDFKPHGMITLKTKPELCVTVVGADSREGGGGDPVHLIRRLSLELCAAAQSRFQHWRVNKVPN